MAYAGIINPLDIETIAINYLAGSKDIFFFLAMGLLAFLAAKYRMPNIVVLMMASLFVVFTASDYPLLYAVVISLSGLLIYYGLAKLINR